MKRGKSGGRDIKDLISFWGDKSFSLFEKDAMTPHPAGQMSGMLDRGDARD